MDQQPNICFVVPCFNEAEALPITGPAFVSKLRELVRAGLAGEGSEILFVDDGSTDATQDAIVALAVAYPEVQGMALGAHRGQQQALYAGMMAARGHFDAVITIDADGQNSLDAIEPMLARYQQGAHVVYAVRTQRTNDTVLKRATAAAFYRAAQTCGLGLVEGHADYRLVSNAALDLLAQQPNAALFLRAAIPALGLPSATVSYNCLPRVAGTSKYTLPKMLRLAGGAIRFAKNGSKPQNSYST